MRHHLRIQASLRKSELLFRCGERREYPSGRWTMVPDSKGRTNWCRTSKLDLMARTGRLEDLRTPPLTQMTYHKDGRPCRHVSIFTIAWLIPLVPNFNALLQDTHKTVKVCWLHCCTDTRTSPCTRCCVRPSWRSAGRPVSPLR
jgi:hypothetical protein